MSNLYASSGENIHISNFSVLTVTSERTNPSHFVFQMSQHVERHSAVPEGRHKRLNAPVLASAAIGDEVARSWPKWSVAVAILSGSHRVRRVSFGLLHFLEQAPPKNLGPGTFVRSPKWLV